MGIGLELKTSSRERGSSKAAEVRSDPRFNSIPRTAKSAAIHCRPSHTSRGVEDGELVKHMTNLPVYLKRVERAEKFQDSVLNVGVLDWSRLEQWKHTNKTVVERGSSSSSLGGGNSAMRKSSGSTKSSSLVRPSRSSEQHASKSIVPEPKNVSSQSLKSYSRSHLGVLGGEKEKVRSADQKMMLEMVRMPPTKYKSFGTLIHPKEDSISRHGVTKKAIEVTQEIDSNMKVLDQRTAKSVRTRSRVQASKQSESDQSFPEQGNRIVLLRPKEAVEKELYRPPSRKCSFSDIVTSDTDHRTELLSTSSPTLLLPETKRDLHPDREYMVKSRSDNTPQRQSLDDPVEILNREDAELTGGNSRNPSPLRRFSFSLGRMGRSLSFKEGTAIPQLSSTHVSVKSGPVSCEPTNCVDNPNKEKAKGHNRARSSPLRRLLDPLLKHKEVNPQPYQPDHRLPPKVISSSFSSGPIYSFPDEKIPESRVQALLQLKVNNGIPLFKFVVDNNRNILAATMKNLGSSGKDDSGRGYTFYLVNEIKKKSGGWMSQATKAKNCGYAYNVVGQMKVSVSESSDIVRESVLFGVEGKKVGSGSPKLVPSRELAAAVVRSHGKEDESVEKECFSESRCLDCVSIVLPGGVHSAPNKGEPSPLISRWRSGGSCDCGGWDVGCKIQVLSDENQRVKVSKGFKDGRILDSFELFVQGTEQNGPIFSLVTSKDGIYSVEYSSLISRLQAFFICVAILSSQKVMRVSPVENVFDSKLFDEADMSGVDDDDDDDRELRAKLPTKYAPIPPLSPVGRV